MTTAKRFIKELATDVALTIAATIGAVLLLSAIAAITNHTAAARPTHTAGRVVVCQTYLSHGAMLAAAETNIPATPSFCAAN